MELIEETRFDDSWAGPEGENWYVGVDRRIKVAGVQFFVRSYDDNPLTAIIMEPENAVEVVCARTLIEYLATNFGYERFEFPCDNSGAFQEVDPLSMTFKIDG